MKRTILQKAAAAAQFVQQTAAQLAAADFQQVEDVNTYTRDMLQALYDATGLSESKPTSDDGLFTIEIVSCLGACGLSPVVKVNDTVHPSMPPEKAADLIEELRAKEGA